MVCLFTLPAFPPPCLARTLGNQPRIDPGVSNVVVNQFSFASCTPLKVHLNVISRHFHACRTVPVKHMRGSRQGHGGLCYGNAWPNTPSQKHKLPALGASSWIPRVFQSMESSKMLFLIFNLSMQFALYLHDRYDFEYLPPSINVCCVNYYMYNLIAVSPRDRLHPPSRGDTSMPRCINQ